MVLYLRTLSETETNPKQVKMQACTTEGESDLETHNSTDEAEGTSKTATNTTTSMSEAILDQLLKMNPALAQRPIRIDKATQKASAIDVVMRVTGQNQQHASLTIRNLATPTNEELFGDICNIRIDGKGKPTPVADVATLQMIIHLLPGKRFASSRAKSLVQAWTLKRKFSDLLQTGKMELTTPKTSVKLELKRSSVSDATSTIEYDYMAGLKPSAIEAMKMADIVFPDDKSNLGVPIEAPTKDGVVYFLRLEGTPMVKVGFSTNLNQRISTLQTACPWKLQLEFIYRTPHYAQLEKTIHRELKSSHVRGEWFHLASDFNYCKFFISFS